MKCHPQNWLSNAGQLDDMQRICCAAQRNQGAKSNSAPSHLAGVIRSLRVSLSHKWIVCKAQSTLILGVGSEGMPPSLEALRIDVS